MSSAAAPPAAVPATAARDRSVRATVAFAAAAMLVSYLPLSAVNGVLGTIGRGAGAGTGDLQWVVDAFTVALTGAVLAGGALAERRGRRRVTIVGLALTGLGSSVGFVAGGVSGVAGIRVLWVGQGLAGLGAGLVMSATLALVAATAPSPQARTRAIAVWAAANVVGLGAGPFLSGAITELAGWRWLFPPIVGCAALVAAVGAACSREVAGHRTGTRDRLGRLLGTAGIVVLVFGVIRGGSAGWHDPAALFALAAGVVALVAFLVVESRSEAPTLRPSLFTFPGFTAAAIAATVALFTVIGVVFAVSLVLAGAHVGDLAIAARLGCLFAGNAIASVLAGLVQTRYGSRPVLVAGLLVAVGGLVTLLSTDAGELAGMAGLSWRLALVGAGCGTVVATSTAVAVQSVPASLAGMAGTANSVVRQLGGALGPAVVGGVLSPHTVGTTGAVHACVVVLLVVLGTATLAVCGVLAAARR
ncbi:Major Facilitator Superfamily protein [Jatrophihabitans endophyticus]|uniref:Major Facilitator Superfamily protein n=1 Tax=Jatrophihabitans endophyticus TaxID=1206085 RepID=A0A1M5QA14_9ACTN|nr:MFS transporter [Jatrophihabitans endophyticus]SHH10770.1 Major Facilitator Superfamily protein [Jatrophihabitans endophyticus]